MIVRVSFEVLIINKIFPDESIHSFLIRKLITEGALSSTSSLNGIVSVSGVVYPMPKVRGEFASYFLDLGICERLDGIARPANEFVRMDTQVRSKYFKVDSHTFYGFGTFSEGEGLVGRTQLRFCNECFIEQLYEHGCVWFKSDWLYEEHCQKHNKLMREVRRTGCSCRGRGGIVNSVLSVTRGLCRVCLDDIWKFETSSLITTNARSDYPGAYLFHDFVIKPMA